MFRHCFENDAFFWARDAAGVIARGAARRSRRAGSGRLCGTRKADERKGEKTLAARRAKRSLALPGEGHCCFSAGNASSMTVLMFWNVAKRDLSREIGEACREHRVEVLILAEARFRRSSCSWV